MAPFSGIGEWIGSRFGWAVRAMQRSNRRAGNK
jgi:hypothetical protein